MRNDISLLEDKHRNEIMELERVREELRAEVCDMRNICDAERGRVHLANDNIKSVEDEKRVV